MALWDKGDASFVYIRLADEQGAGGAGWSELYVQLVGNRTGAMSAKSLLAIFCSTDREASHYKGQ